MKEYPIKRILKILILAIGTSIVVISRTVEKGNAITTDPAKALALTGILCVVYVLIDFVYFQINSKPSVAGSTKSNTEKKIEDEERKDYFIILFSSLLFPYVAPFYFLYKSKEYPPKKQKFARIVGGIAVIFGVFIVSLVAITFARR